MRSEGRGEQLFLFDIKEAIERIRDFTREGQAEFHDSFVIQDAVVKNLLVIGEAARRLSGTAVEKAPEISWSHIVRLRDVLIHGYYKIDLDVVWEVVKHDLDPLYEAVSRMLEDN